MKMSYKRQNLCHLLQRSEDITIRTILQQIAISPQMQTPELLNTTIDVNAEAFNSCHTNVTPH